MQHLENMIAMKRIVEQIERFVDIGIALSVEKNTTELLNKILLGAKDITHADGGTIYCVEGDEVRIEIFHSDSLGLALIGSPKHLINMPSIPLYIDGQPNLTNVVSYSYHQDSIINIQNAYDTDRFDFAGTKALDERNNYHSISFLAIPLKDHNGETIGVLQLINAIDPESKAIIPFDSTAQRFAHALASIAATVLTKQKLITDSMDYNKFIAVSQMLLKSSYTEKE